MCTWAFSQAHGFKLSMIMHRLTHIARITHGISFNNLTGIWMCNRDKWVVQKVNCRRIFVFEEAVRVENGTELMEDSLLLSEKNAFFERSRCDTLTDCKNSGLYNFFLHSASLYLFFIQSKVFYQYNWILGKPEVLKKRKTVSSYFSSIFHLIYWL